jgi:hypothetical protein
MHDEGTILSWEDAQQLMLPPDASVLIPPHLIDDVPVVSNRPGTLPDWLTDEDPEALRAAIEREQFGPGPVRLLTQVVAVNALWQAAESLRQKPEEDDDDSRSRRHLSPTPDDPSEIE